MLGFATIDHQPGASEVGVWLTARVGELQVDHTNAVLVDVDADIDGLRKVFALTRDRVVMLTGGSTAEGLPIDGSSAWGEQELMALTEATKEHQEQIAEAVATYRRDSRASNLVQPSFPPLPAHDPREDSGLSCTQRALRAADVLRLSWLAWMSTDEERRRRTRNPRTKCSPWIMPPHLSGAELQVLPPQMMKHAAPEPVGAFDA